MDNEGKDKKGDKPKPRLTADKIVVSECKDPEAP